MPIVSNAKRRTYNAHINRLPPLVKRPEAPVVKPTFKNVSVTKSKDPDELGKQLLEASKQNDVSAIKKLLSWGAPIDYREPIDWSPGTYYHSREIEEQLHPTPLHTALGTGAFDAALYLTNAGANPTLGVFKDEYDPNIHMPGKPLGLVIASKNISYGSGQRVETELYSSEERMALFDAFVDNVVARGGDPLDITEQYDFSRTDEPKPTGPRGRYSLHQALDFGRADFIPKFHKLGVEIQAYEFICAAGEDNAIELMSALLPYMNYDVNTLDSNGQNAGEKAAFSGNLDAFKWLDDAGLDKNSTKYAEALGSRNRATDDSKLLEFAQFLADKGYPLGNAAQVAFSENPEIGMVFVRNGARLEPGSFIKAIGSSAYRNTTSDDMIFLAETLEKNGLLTVDVMREALEKAQKTFDYWDNCSDVRRGIESLAKAKKALTPLCEALETKLRAHADPRSAPTFASPSV